jgi:hypothetical protein
MMHTPGPWQIKSDYEPLEIIGNVDGPDDGQMHYTPICAVEPTLFPDENAANARLIAAAPDLLAIAVIAEQFMTVATDWNFDECEIDGKMRRTHELLKEVRAAITRAGAHP